ncbi:MAG TPA: hypothetical protein VH331_00890 [Allosphingosinicella sp.]|jgi:hypothetical protein|nr:hypothetical protein [Allosphingosinicella sp.]
MVRYYLHFRDGTDESLDPEGREFSDIQAVRRAALEGARDVIANEIKSGGVMDLRYRIEVENEAGTIVHRLAFKDAVTIIGENV